jgi:hypothetical protein
MPARPRAAGAARPGAWILPCLCLALAAALPQPCGAGEIPLNPEWGDLPEPQHFPADPAGWPELTREAKPWTRWWWLGSAVDAANLTRELEAFAAAGLGGVEICPIYGAMGAEERYLEFLSPEWLAMLAHVTREGGRLGLGVDLTTGTGWPFGGPWVGAGEASAGFTPFTRKVAGGAALVCQVPAGRAVALRAWHGQTVVDLAGKLDGRTLRWDAPPLASGEWLVAGGFTNSPVQQVKRAAPGGAGPVVDPFSTDALGRYLARFDQAFAGFGAPPPRAHFHDSFEYYGAAWTPGLPEAFAARHGYQICDQLPALLGSADLDTTARVRADYRETLGEMHRAFLARWNHWAKAGGSLTRNQAHGSPGNLLDHYAVADIPETEIFRHVAEDQIPMLQFAASAARTTGRPLVSAESFTWLDEHFKVAPDKLKAAADFLFLGGVNHLFFHGIPFSPEDAGWPGWLFYASTHLGPNGGLWRDLPVFTGYLARCQAILQSGTPDSDLLVYFPAHDLFHEAPGLLPLFTIHDQHRWLQSLPFYQTVMGLWQRGVYCDFVSDALLDGATVADGRIRLGGNEWPALVLPRVRRIPPATLAKLLALARAGGTVVFEGGLPEDVPGFGELAARRLELLGLLDNLSSSDEPAKHVKIASNGLDAMLDELGIVRERMSDLGIRCVRRRHAEGYHYFVVNRGGRDFSGVLPLARAFRSAVGLDPMQPGRAGVLRAGSGRQGKGVELALAAGESLVIRTFDRREVDAGPFPVLEAAGAGSDLTGMWRLEFVSGGPELPAPADLPVLGSWTALADPRARAFHGTGRYRLDFELAAAPVGRLGLELGRVAGTARVQFNGIPVGPSWCAPHRLEVTGLAKPGRNTLEVEVTNLAANRIADLDRRKIPWKLFHEINFVNIDYQPFDAAAWAPVESGLLGPVRLVPLAPAR